jgi:hypothetical protein
MRRTILYSPDENAIHKIFAISLTDRKRFKAYAVFNAEQLIVERLVEIKGIFSSWRPALVEEVLKRKDQGFTLLIEEKTDHISRHGTQFLFEDRDEMEMRINYYVALDWYFALKNIGNIILPPGAEQFHIKEQYAEKLQDEQGRIKYNINWEQLTGGHRAILLCVMATVLNPLNETYIEKMFGGRLDDKDEQDPFRTWKAITIGVDKARAAHWNAIDEGRK